MAREKALSSTVERVEMTPEEYRRFANKSQSEEDFQNQVIGLARLFRWKVAHFRRVKIQRSSGACYWSTPVQADGAGFTDLLMVRERVIYAELKKQNGKLDPEQEVWRDALLAAKQEWYCWKPADFDRIIEILK